MIEPVEIPSSALVGSRSDWRKAVRDFISANLQGKSLRNRDTGWDIRFNAESRSEAVSKLRSEPQFRAAKQIVQIVERAIYLGDAIPDGSRQRDTERFFYFAVPVTIDGHSAVAWFNTRKPLQTPHPDKGGVFYEFGLYDKAARTSPGLDTGNQPDTPTFGPDETIGSFLEKIKDVLPAAIKVREAGLDTDMAYSLEALEVNEAADGNSPTALSDRRADISSLEGNLEAFLRGVKEEHRSQTKASSGAPDSQAGASSKRTLLSDVSQPDAGSQEGAPKDLGPPSGTWESDPDLPDSTPVFRWTTEPKSVADIYKALNEEAARIRDERVSLIAQIAKLQGKHRTIRQIKMENALLARLAELKREEIPRMRAIVAVPISQRALFEASNIPPAGLERGFDQAAAIVTAYLDSRLMPTVKISALPANQKRAGHKNGTIYYGPGHSGLKVAHEVMHAVEQQYDHVLKAALKFLKQRTTGETPVKLSEATGDPEYGADEVTLRDEWKEKGGHIYTGKYYSDEHATEILTMGIERLHNDPLLFARTDPDYFSFVVKTLRMW